MMHLDRLDSSAWTGGQGIPSLPADRWAGDRAPLPALNLTGRTSQGRSGREGALLLQPVGIGPGSRGQSALE